MVNKNNKNIPGARDELCLEPYPVIHPFRPRAPVSTQSMCLKTQVSIKKHQYKKKITHLGPKRC